MFDNLSRRLQEANELINHYNQLNQLVNTQLAEINELKAQIVTLESTISDTTERSRP